MFLSKWYGCFRNSNKVFKPKKFRNHCSCKYMISTAEAVMNNNHKVIFCDINLHDYSICLKDLKSKLQKTQKRLFQYTYMAYHQILMKLKNY